MLLHGRLWMKKLKRNQTPIWLFFIELIGKVSEEKDKMHSVMDDAFGVQVNYFDGEVTFTQKVKLKSDDSAMLSGFVYYMVCSDIMCVPKDMEFNITLGK